MLAKAEAGIYTAIGSAEALLPEGHGAQAGRVKVRPELRAMIRFEQLNLTDADYGIAKPFDAIFCRNVMIYFDKPTQGQVLSRFEPLVKPGGLLFAGHSENFTYVTQAFRLRGQTVYERPATPHRARGRGRAGVRDAVSRAHACRGRRIRSGRARMSALPIATNRYFDNHFGRPGVKLLPNEFYTTSEDMVLMTVLGSCVAACLHDPYAASADEPLHAARRRRRSGRGRVESMRYGAYAMEVLINEMIKAGGRRERFEAKVFGRRRAGRDDDDQHRRPQRGFRAPLPRARTHPHHGGRPAGRAPAQGRVHGGHGARGGEEAAAAVPGVTEREAALARGRSRPRRTAASAGRAVRGQASGPAAAGAPAHRAVRRAQRAGRRRAGGEPIKKAGGMTAVQKIKVLCVDDSALIRSLMTEIINSQPDMTVCATAPDPLVARELIKQHNPDVLTLDVEMPRMDGRLPREADAPA